MRIKLQQTINERLKILINALDISARAFSAQLDVPESNTRNYLDKNTKLNSDYLERIATHFKSVNLSWLITGEGEPFLPGTTPNTNINQTQKKVKGSVVGTIQGTVTTNNYGLADCEKERDSLRAERDSLAKQVELLHGQLQTKDALIAAKDEMLDLLRGGFNRPN